MRRKRGAERARARARARTCDPRTAPAPATRTRPTRDSDPTSTPPGPPLGFTAAASAPVPAANRVLTAVAASEAPAADNAATTWTSGYHNGTFFLRDKSDIFRLYVMGRAHVDWLDEIGAGVTSLPPGSGVTDGFFLRRARLELAGEFYERWQFWVGAETASATSIDDAAANQVTPTCSAAGNSFLSCSNKSNVVDNPTVKAIPTDVFINYGPTPWTNFQAGQFYLPFSLENRISDNTTWFLERSLPVRNIGAPLQRDIGLMFWGESPDRSVYYAVAVMNGDGPNRPNVDSRYDFAARAVYRPFAATTESFSKWLQVGVSARQGSRDPAKVGYDLPSMTTQGGFAFWKPIYRDSLGRTIHILPSSSQWAVGADLFAPVGNLDIMGEFIYLNEGTREAVDGYQLSPFTERIGALTGVGWYAQVGYWILGDQDIIGPPSYGRPIHVDLTKPQKRPQDGLQAMQVKFEQLPGNYGGNSRGGALDSLTPNGNINVDAFEVGFNYWATKHLRVGLKSARTTLFPRAPRRWRRRPGGPVQSATQRAMAPAQLLTRGVDDGSRDGAHDLHELQARVGVQF